MKKLLTWFISFASTTGYSQNSCNITNKAFQNNEQLTYEIFYNWGAIWMETGEVTFTTKLEELNGNKVFHFSGIGATYPKYDWFYKVRDKYESYADTNTIKPLRFVRNVNEGRHFAHDDYIFSSNKKKIFTVETRAKNVVKIDSIPLQPCTNDVLTAIYYSRCLNFEEYKPNDTIPITFVLDGKTYNSYMRYKGKETITTPSFGTIRCIKFSPKLLEGTIFKGGEGMTVWATDDANKIPVYVETPITVGFIKVKLIKHQGLRNKVDCYINKSN